MKALSRAAALRGNALYLSTPSGSAVPGFAAPRFGASFSIPIDAVVPEFLTYFPSRKRAW